VTAVPESSSGSLVMPVAGIRPEELQDTYLDARSEGRVHEALDIMAPQGTPVLAAADGRIVRLFSSERGGTTIYQMSADSSYIFYYAHLDRYAESIQEGQEVRRGMVIAYVGNTGNAGPENYHLHFAIWRITDPGHYWDGVNINPYPLLRGWSSLGDSVMAVTGNRSN
jgi:murein DD-endopeptidase MepM/ murein hydrolase activator NlpD